MIGSSHSTFQNHSVNVGGSHPPYRGLCTGEDRQWICTGSWPTVLALPAQDSQWTVLQAQNIMTGTLQSHITYAPFQYTMFLTTVLLHTGTGRTIHFGLIASSLYTQLFICNGLHTSINTAFS